MRPVLLLLAVFLTACGVDSSVDAVGPEPTGVNEPPPWQRLDDPPLEARSGAAIGWTGEEIVVVGGSTFMCPPGADCVRPTEPPFRDGAALDPSNGEWRPIADAPDPVPSHQPTTHLGGDVYILVTPLDSGPSGARLLRYRTDADAWEAYDVPADAHLGGLLAAGTGLVVYPGSDEIGETPDLWFDPSSEAWSELPADPLSPSFDRIFAWSNDGLYLFAKDIAPSPGGASGPAVVNVAELLDGRWSEGPTGNTIGFWEVISDGDRIVAPQMGCADGGEVNIYGRCIPFGAVFDTRTGTWSELPPASREANQGVSGGALGQDRLLLTRLGHQVLNLSTDTWFQIPEIDERDDNATVQRTFAGAGPYGFAFNWPLPVQGASGVGRRGDGHHGEVGDLPAPLGIENARNAGRQI